MGCGALNSERICLEHERDKEKRLPRGQDAFRGTGEYSGVGGEGWERQVTPQRPSLTKPPPASYPVVFDSVHSATLPPT